MKNQLMLGMAVASLFAAVPAMAQSQRYTTVYGAGPYYYAPYGRGPQGPSADQINQYENGYSGTLGRQGLGADPRHPEGPGNAVSPR